jgi:hypothetical protein
MYIHTFASDDFTYQGNPVPTEWIKRRRGQPGLSQRLEFGPSDAEPIFLDDIFVEEIAGNPQPLKSGYLVAKRIEVGPNVVIGSETEFAPPYIEIPASPGALDCSQADVCQFVQREKDAYEAEHGTMALRGAI